MSGVIARFRRGEDRIAVKRGMDATEAMVVKNPEHGTTVVKSMPVGALSWYFMVLSISGWHWLKLCGACGGSGDHWATDRHGEAVKDVCEACQGEGGV